jgi:CubicO group peptidase (beta-lactamase class C family)
VTDPQASLADFDASVDAYAQQVFTDARASAGFVVLVKGSDVYAKHYGIRSDESGLPVDGRTAFDIGSCAKAFTATAAALQVERGKLSWDEPLCKIVPEFALYDDWVSRDLTLRDALSNRLCIQRETPLEFGIEPHVPTADILRRARFARRLYPFRDRFSYSNLGFVAASVAVSRSAGQPYADFLQQQLLAPLGMSRTVHVGEWSGDDNTATAYTTLNGQRTAVPEFVFPNYHGAGELLSTSEDLVRWLRFNLANGGDLLGKGLAMLHRPQVRIDPEQIVLWHSPLDALFSSYGLGWAVTHLAGRRLVQHSGVIPGTLASVAFLPEDGIGVAVCVASPQFQAHTVLSYHVLEAALGLSPRDWRAESVKDVETKRARAAALLPDPATMSGGPAVDVAGVYRSAVAGDVSITGSGESYILEYPDCTIWRQHLQRRSGNLFDGVFTEAAGLAFSAEQMAVWFSMEGTRPVALHHPFFGSAHKLDPTGGSPAPTC